MVIKALTGQVKAKSFTGSETEIAYQGAVIVAYGVRFTSISGLTYGQSNNDI